MTGRLVSDSLPSGVKVKICGLTNPADAGIARDAGADFLGAVLSPGFSRSIGTDRAETFHPLDGARLVAVMVDPTVDEAAEVSRSVGATVIQLHGEEPRSLVEAVRGEGDWMVWKGLKIRTAADLTRALDLYGGIVHGFLLDAWHRGRGGGTGRRFPWEAIASAREEFPADTLFIAAGGLRPDNVAEAVTLLRPDVVDVSSGVERAVGAKDAALVEQFVRNARAGKGS